jgi:hypothetical membrane protein
MGPVGRRTLGLIVIASNAYWILVVLAMHLLEPEFSPIRAPMSAYVLGAYGPLMTTTYFALCTALLGASYGLVKDLRRSRLAKVAFVITLIAGTGILIAGIFPMDFPPPPRTSSGRLHMLGGLLTFPQMTLASLLFSLSMRRDGHWRGVSAVALPLSAGAVAAFVLMFVSLRVFGFAGFAQRIVMALLLGWMAVVGLHLTAPRLPYASPEGTGQAAGSG